MNTTDRSEQPARGATDRWRTSCDRFAERADEGCSTSPTRPTDSPFGPLLLAATPRGAGHGRPAEPDTDELLERPRGADLAPGARGAGAARRGPPRARPLLRGQPARVRPAARLAAQHGFRRKVLRAIARIPYGQTRSYTEMAAQRRQRARRARRRHGLRLQPDPDRRPLPPRPAQRRRPRRLRRRPADEGALLELEGVLDGGPPGPMRSGCGASTRRSLLWGRVLASEHQPKRRRSCSGSRG